MRLPGGSAGLAPLALLGAIAILNALAAVIVFPLAPFVAAGLGVPAPEAAWASLAFTLAAGAGGLTGALLPAAADRRRVLTGALAGLGLGSLAAGLAPDFPLLLAARAASGFCSGPLLAAVFAIIPDIVAPARRGRAFSLVVGAYGMALAIGLPGALLLAAAGGWRLPFLALAALCLPLLPACRAVFRPTPRGAAAPVEPARLLDLLRRPESATGLALIASASFATLLVSPHLGTFGLRNAGLDSVALGSVYLLGGGLALLATRATGWAMDRLGALPAAFGASLALTLAMLLAFGFAAPVGPAVPVLALVLATQLARSTLAQASAAQLAAPADRLTYQCLVAAATSLAQAAGAACSIPLLAERADGHLAGMGSLAALSVAAAWIALPLLALLRAQRRRRLP
jgi:predicted MFS family arabinose efflux permease